MYSYIICDYQEMYTGSNYSPLISKECFLLGNRYQLIFIFSFFVAEQNLLGPSILMKI